ncbi:MAG TPA: hypothetical protein VJU86_02530 [Pyrinomonadaceae bacterium]|nr:hypothetical protein [Pyrinomonadaceae bacterium]
MISKTLLRKFIAVWVTAAILSVTSVLTAATPVVRSGGLSVTGQVTVDGQSAISGGTFFSDSTIVTGANSGVTVGLGKLGRVELSANSSLTLSFTENSLVGSLHAGRGYVSTPAGVFVNIATKDAFVSVDGSEATAVNINSETANTMVATDTGRAELRTGNGIEEVTTGQNAVAGTAFPQQLVIARITTRNNQPITVNGSSAASGANLLTGATIETPAGVGATINLGSLGELDIAPNTELTLEFDHNGNVVKVNLKRGCALLRTRNNVNGQIDTPDGTSTKTESRKRADVCFPLGATAPVANQGAAAAAGAGAGAAATGGGLSTAALAAILLGAGGAVAAAVILATGDDEEEVIVSPAR